MSKYDPLQRFLRRKRPAAVELTFAEIELIIRGPLPKRSLELGWWTEPQADPRRGAHQAAWITLGYVVEPRIAEEKVFFQPKGD